MGRRSINTTKSGKYMNPTDQARKEARKRELKKNKKQRMAVRQAVLKGKDPFKLIEDMEMIDQMEYDIAAPPKLNERVLKDKRKKLQETLERVMKLYEKEDPEYCVDLKRSLIECEKKRYILETRFNEIKMAEKVQLDQIPLPDAPSILTVPSMIPLPSEHHLPDILISHGIDKPLPGILKRHANFIAQHLSGLGPPLAPPRIMFPRKMLHPPGPPPGPPLEFTDSEEEEAYDPESGFDPNANVVETAPVEATGVDSDKDTDNEKEVDVKKKKKLKKRKIRFEDDSEYDSDADEKDSRPKIKEHRKKKDSKSEKKKKKEMSSSSNSSSSSSTSSSSSSSSFESSSSSSSSASSSDSEEDKKPKKKSNKKKRAHSSSSSDSDENIKSSKKQSKVIPPGPPPGLPPTLPPGVPPGPPPGLPPNMMARPPPLRPPTGVPLAPPRAPPGVPPRLLPPGPPPGRPPGMPPGPPPGRPPGIPPPAPPVRLPPGPPGVPQLNLRPVTPISSVTTVTPHMLPPGTGMPLSLPPSVLSAPPSLLKPATIEREEPGSAVIEAKPQLKHTTADLTRFMPTALRVRRDVRDAKGRIVKLGAGKDDMPGNAKSSAPPVTNKDEAYDMFMKEMENLL